MVLMVGRGVNEDSSSVRCARAPDLLRSGPCGRAAVHGRALTSLERTSPSSLSRTSSCTDKAGASSTQAKRFSLSLVSALSAAMALIRDG